MTKLKSYKFTNKHYNERFIILGGDGREYKVIACSSDLFYEGEVFTDKANYLEGSFDILKSDYDIEEIDVSHLSLVTSKDIMEEALVEVFRLHTELRLPFNPLLKFLTQLFVVNKMSYESTLELFTGMLSLEYIFGLSLEDYNRVNKALVQVVLDGVITKDNLVLQLSEGLPYMMALVAKSSVDAGILKDENVKVLYPYIKNEGVLPTEVLLPHLIKRIKEAVDKDFVYRT